MVAGNISRNRGANTAGVDGQTHQDISGNLGSIRECLRTGEYSPKPTRRVYIPKRSGKLRPLGIPTATDKLGQAMAARILEEIYEPVFSDHSHGFRKGRSCHTALDELKHNWAGTKWIIEADIAEWRGTHKALLHNPARHKIHDRVSFSCVIDDQGQEMHSNSMCRGEAVQPRIRA